MAVNKTFWMAAATSGAVLSFLAACSPSPDTAASPPPPPPQAPPPPLAGGPDGYVSQRDLAPIVVTMNPIPNPGDMSPAERAHIYGPGWRRHHEWVERHDGAAPEYRAGYRGGERRHWVAAPHPVVRAAAPQPIRPVVRAAVAPPHVAIAPKPVVTPIAKAPAPVPAKPLPKIVQLQSVLGQAVSTGSILAVSPDISKGKPGGVSLTLPGALSDAIRDQAAKLGFKRAARQADVSATLTGDGYTITPNGKQTQTIKHGEAVKFFWQVTPGQTANGPLHAQIDAALKGAGAPKLLSLATLQSAVVQAGDQAQQAASGLHMPDFLSKLFGQHDAPATAAPATAAQTGPLHDHDLPIFGHVSVRAQIAAFLAFVAVLILLLIQRNMSEQKRAAERRRFRSMHGGGSNYRPMEMDPEPSSPTPSAS